MQRSRKPWWWLGLLCALGSPEAANAQANGQMWGTATLDYLASERLTYQLELEPKSQIVVHTRQPTWFDLHTTPHVDYAVAPWIEWAKWTIAFMNQSAEVNTTRAAPRVGAQLHILSRIIQAHTAEHGAAREKLPEPDSHVRNRMWQPGAVGGGRTNERDRPDCDRRDGAESVPADGEVGLSTDRPGRVWLADIGIPTDTYRRAGITCRWPPSRDFIVPLRRQAESQS
jgi:hypothetical protein